MRVFEAKFILQKTIEIKQLGIKFRKLKASEKRQIVSDLEKYYFNNSFLEDALKNDFNMQKMDIEKIEFWNKLDKITKEVCMLNNLLTTNRFQKLNIDETISKLNHLIVIECDESILVEYIDKEKITKFISNILSLYGIYSSPLEMTEKVRFDYSYILETELLNREAEKYYVDLILNFATNYIDEGKNIVPFKYVNVSQKYLFNLQKLLKRFDKSDIRAFVSSVDLMFTENSTTENRIINMTSIIEKLLISSDENINKDFVLKAGLILKRTVKTENDLSNIAIKELLSFSYKVRSCIVHGNEEKAIDYLSKMIKKDKTIIKLCKIEGSHYLSKIENAYIIAEMTLYMTLRAIIKFWFDFPSELKFIKMN